MSDIVTRAGTGADAAGVAAVCDTAWPHGTEALIEELHTAPETFFVAEALGTIVAFLQASVWHNWPAVAGMEHHDPDAGDSKLLNWLAVHETRRDRGLGGTLLDAWLTQLPPGIRYVVLNPWPAEDTAEVAAERLRRFYVRHGFQLLPDSDGVEGSYLLGWAAPDAWLPESPPWPEPPSQDTPVALRTAEEDARSAAYIVELKARLGVRP